MCLLALREYGNPRRRRNRPISVNPCDMCTCGKGKQLYCSTKLQKWIAVLETAVNESNTCSEAFSFPRTSHIFISGENVLLMCRSHIVYVIHREPRRQRVMGVDTKVSAENITRNWLAGTARGSKVMNNSLIFMNL